MRSTIGRASFAAPLLALAVTPVVAQEHEHMPHEQQYYSADVETMKGKFIELADAMPAETYSWRPMEGVRSVSEVYMLMAAEFYAIPDAWGVERPAGVPAGNAVWRELPQVTDKQEVLDHLRRSSEHFQNAVDHLDAETLHRNIQFFGQERTVAEAVFVILGDMHEHLGQAIAYARMNEIVPPWTARQQQGN